AATASSANSSPSGTARARALHRRAGCRTHQGDGRGGLHDRHAADVLRASPQREGHRGRRRLSTGRGDARECRLSLDPQPHHAGGRSPGTLPGAPHRGGDIAMATVPLVNLAKTIRSKNAGVDKVTFDVIFQDKKSYDLVRTSRAL